MPKGGRFVDIQKSPSTINNWRLVTKELTERAEALHKIVSYLAAKNAFDMIKDEIPGGSDYADLKESLQLVEIGVGGKNRAGYAIYAPTKSKRIRKLDVPKTVLYVRAKKRLVRPDPAVQILEDKGPWTADTIPFWPTKKEATVIQRKVTKKEADKVAKMQSGKIAGIRSELREMGRKIKKGKPGDPGKVTRRSKAIPDVAMQALEMEFGGGSGKSKPVFRRMIKSISSSIGRMAISEKIIGQTMTNPNSKRYKSFPPKLDKISSGQASKFAGFQNRLGR